MSKKRLALILVLLNLSIQPPVALAQTSTATLDDSWKVVKALPFGVELEIKRANRKTLKGRLHSVTDATLRLSSKDEITELARADVIKVYRLYRKSEEFKRMSSGVGATIGGGVGLMVGISASRRSRYGGSSTKLLLIPLIGTVLGAVGGYMIGEKMKRRLLIYDEGQRQQVSPSGQKAKQPQSSKPPDNEI